MRFTKMQGVGNDFVVIDAAGFDGDPAALAARVCSRRFGVGVDGLLLVGRLVSTASLFTFRMFNPDGTEDMCGNGLRCVSLWAHRHGWLKGATHFTVDTKDGPRAVRLIDVAGDGMSGAFKVDMGVPRLSADEIPVCGTPLTSTTELQPALVVARGACLCPETVVCDFPLTVGDRVFQITSANTGSTHTVIFGPQPDDGDFSLYGPLIEHHAFFPERTSVQWATIHAPSVRRTISMPVHEFIHGSNDANASAPLEIVTRIWERGAGETLGCGTGACAVAVAARQLGLAALGQPVDVVSRGGTLHIEWDGPETPVWMSGPAELVFEGALLLE